MKKSKKLNSFSLAGLLGLFAGMSGDLKPRKSDHTERDSNRMPLTKDELKHLASLSGKDKKIYVRKLREKYHGVKA